MTLEPRPIVAITLDTHPRRPEVLKHLAQHWRCCCVWRVSAGSCSGDGVGSSGLAATTFENASAELIDFSTAFKQLPGRLQKVMGIIVEHGPTDRYDGDPGHMAVRGAGTDGEHFDHAEEFWCYYAGRLNLPKTEWFKAQEMEDLALYRMSVSLGWRPLPEPAS